MGSMIGILELFAGLGAASKALTNLGIGHEIVDAVEIDKYAIEAFNAIHDTNFKPQDISEWDKDIKCDLIFHGSPCQSFSIAGLQEGGDEGSGTQSSLMYESIRIIKKIRPKYVVWENVKNLLSEKHRHNFDYYLEQMEELGYQNYYQILNAKDYGIPQNRERVFVVSILGGGDFKFPTPIPLEKGLKDVLEPTVDEKYYLSSEQSDKFEPFDSSKIRQSTDGIIKVGILNIKGQEQIRRVYDPNGVAPTISTMQGGNRQPKIIDSRSRIRKLTPLTCYRLMGFSDEDFAKVSKKLSNAQLYKTAGNSVAVDVLMAIFKELFKDGRE